MGAPKGHPKWGGGSRKGKPNKSTRDLRECILMAFHKVGGASYLERIARKNPAVFCTLLNRILPAQLHASILNLNLDAYAVGIGGELTRDALTGGPEQEPAETPV